ncbi:MAG: hypothetical protein FWC20_01495 [Oscillospiraceae bacterium]|nr:hypothetical protein [Oscillospiraceae bacterium]MCL2278067.1 hypothetical protein [Oscillospiraceae bacterium]
MLSKLMKYEFMAMGRIFLPLFGALLIVSAITGIFGLLDLTVPTGISIAVSIMLIVGIFVVVFILTIQRFWNNLLASEGYLTMTLPVSTDRLIISKLLVASVWNIVSIIVVVGAVLIMVGHGLPPLSVVMQGFDGSYFVTHEAVFIIVQLVIFLILCLFSGILLLYACMSLGMLVNKYRPLVSFGAYIVITTALQIITAITITVGIATGGFESFMNYAEGFSEFVSMQIFMWIAIGVVLLLCAAFYAITRCMLSKRLNLQ